MSEEDGPSHDYRALYDTIHGWVRLAVMAYLSGAGSAEFGTLKARTGVSDGNLSTHLRKLEEAGFVNVEKRFENRKPLTVCHLTAAGREAWIGYLDQMRALLFDGDTPG